MGAQRVQYLEGLRGIAACVVVLHHAVLAFYPALYTGSVQNVRSGSGVEVLISGTPLNVLYNGTFCVSIFFVLSGYVLSRRFFHDGCHEGLISSAARRYFRLVLPVAASVFIAYSCMKLYLFQNQEAARVTSSKWLATWWNFNPSFFDMLGQAFFGSLFRYEMSYNNVLWIMTYELYGALLVLGLLALFGRLRGRYLFYTAAVFLLWRTYYLSFILGLVLSDLHNSPKKRLKAVNNTALTVSLLVLGLFLGSYPPGRETVSGTIYQFLQLDLDMRFPFLLHHEAGAALVLAAIVTSAPLQRMLSYRIIQYVGALSFSLYLTHLIVLFTFSCFVFMQAHPALGHGAAFLVTMVMSVPVMLIIAHLLSRYVDAPGVKLSNYLYRTVLQGGGEGMSVR